MYNKDSFSKEIIQVYALFLVMTLAIYKAPFPIATVLQIFSLIIFYRTDKDYFWLAFIFVVESNPGALFTVVDAPRTFAILTSSPVGVLFYWLVFVIIATIKAQKYKLSKPLYLTNILIACGIFMIIQILAFGVGSVSYIKALVPLALIYILPRLLKDSNDFDRFFNIIFSFVFFVLAAQLIFLVTGKELNTFLGGINPSLSILTVEDTESAMRPTSGIVLPFLSIIGSTYLIVYKKTTLSKNYLYLVFITSLLSIFITATRGWMISSVFIAFVFMMVVAKNPFSLLPKLILPIIAIVLLFTFVPFLNKQADMALSRYETLESLFQGDKTAGGTLSRLDERGPRVMKKFWESPILGWGNSSTGLKYSDGHVGNHNLLMRTGIVGFSLMVIFWLSYLFKTAFRNADLSENNPFKNTPLLLCASFIALIIVHSSSSQWFSFGFGFRRGYVVFILLALGNHVYWESIKEEYLLKSKKKNM